MIGAESELYAGGACGLFVLSQASQRALWRPLLEYAEASGISGMLSADPAEVVAFSVLGIRHVVLVSDVSRLSDALRMTQQTTLSALCLLSPDLPQDPDLTLVVSKLRLPRLLLSSSAPDAVGATRRFDARSAGAVAMRFVPFAGSGAGLLADPANHAAESICLFALRTVNTALQRHPHPGLAA